MAEKIYVGIGWKSKQYDIINISINLDECKEYITEYNGKKQLRLAVAARKSPGKSGDTHYVMIDTYKKTEKLAPVSGNKNVSEVLAGEIDPNDIPF